MNKDNNIALTVINTKDGSPTIYRTEVCKLMVTIINETSDVINLQPGQTCLYIEIPGITTDELKSTIITADNWNIDIDDTIIELTYTDTGQTQWTNNGKLTVTIDGLKTDAQPQTGNLQVNTTGFNPQIPSQLFAPITISNPPKHGNANLHDVLQIKADNGGVIFISPISENSKLEKLENELLLNIKNISDAPLYSTTKGEPSKKSPRIEVTFVYGSTIGCLTPCNEGEGGTYAWDIHGAVFYKTPEYGWVAHQPQQSGNNPCPKWVFQPESTNIGLIGSGPNANITLAFSHIIAVTPPGHTQVLLHFIDFMKNDTTPYDDALFVLDIVKKSPPQERGIINFYCETPVLIASSKQEIIKLPLKWTAYYVDKVDIIIHSPVIAHYSIEPYPTHHLPVLKDRKNIDLSGIIQDTVCLTTIQAYDSSGTFLNSKQFSVVIKSKIFTDPRDGKSYPTITVNDQIWMAEDLIYNTNQGSQPVEKRKPDRVYNWEAAQSPVPLSGWRLPTRKDWENLINAHQNTPYDQLIKGGISGFNAVLNGFHTQGNSLSFNKKGMYWTADEESEKAGFVVFSSTNHTVSVKKDLTIEKSDFLSVRYVKNLNNEYCP